MALTTYAGLKSSVADWLHRTDLTSVIPDFISLAESRLRREVRCRAMLQSATGTLSSSTLAFPTRMAEVVRVILGGDVQEFVTMDDFNWQDDVDTGKYTIQGESFLFQSSTEDYQIDYYQWFAAFSDDADYNWLLTNHPGVYLYSSLVESCIYTLSDPSVYESKYQQSLAQLKQAEAKAKAGGRIQVRTDNYA